MYFALMADRLTVHNCISTSVTFHYRSHVLKVESWQPYNIQYIAYNKNKWFIMSPIQLVWGVFSFIGQTMESDSYGPLFEANVMADRAAGELSPRSTFNLCYLMRIPEGHRFQDNL